MNEKLIQEFNNYIYHSDQSKISEANLVHLMSDNDTLKWILTEFHTKHEKHIGKKCVDLLNQYIGSFENKIIDIYNIVDAMGDKHYMMYLIHKIGKVHPFSEELKKIIIEKHLDIMVRTGYYISQVINSKYMTSDNIELILNSIEIHGITTYGFVPLLQNTQMTAIQLDRLATLLKKDNNTIMDNLWLYLLLNPNINSVIIKKYLSNPSLEELLKSQSAESIETIVIQNKNKPSIDKLALIETFPFLVQYGLKACPLEVSIDTLEVFNK